MKWKSSQTVLDETETDICAICSTEDDKEGTAKYEDWISCSRCFMCVQATCTDASSSNEYTLRLVLLAGTNFSDVKGSWIWQVVTLPIF